MVSDAAHVNALFINLSHCHCTVLIQPNLKFLHELLGWEIETRANESRGQPTNNVEILQRYSWPSLCRDLVSGFGPMEHNR